MAGALQRIKKFYNIWRHDRHNDTKHNYTLYDDTQYHDSQHNDSQHINSAKKTPNITTLSITPFSITTLNINTLHTTLNITAFSIATLVIMTTAKESLLKGKDQYDLPPCTNQLRSAALHSENIFIYFTKQPILMRRSTTLSLTFQ